MPVTLAQLYGGGSGSGGISSIVAPPKTELELTSSFAVPAMDGTDVTEVSTAQYLSVGQFVFLSDGNNYGSFQITAINDKTLTLKNYGGEIVGVGFAAGSRLVPSGRDGDDAVPADVVTGTEYDEFRVQTLNSIGSLTTNKMDKAVYDADNDGIVDSAAGIDGVDVAGNSKYYGTDGSGVEGFHDLPTTPTPTFADIQGLARDNVDLAGELEDLETAIAGKFDNPTGTTAQYLRGDGSVATFPTIPTPPTTVKTFGSYNSTTPTVSTIYLFTATTATTINELRGLKTTSGTCTLSIQINGVNVTGLSGLSVTSTPQNPTASADNIATVGQDVTLVISAVSSPNKLQFTLGATVLLT